MRQQWLRVAILGVMIGLGTTSGFAQSRAESANEARLAEAARQLRQGNGNGGSEFATVLPYMAVMAVFLGGGLFAFVAGRNPKTKGR